MSRTRLVALVVTALAAFALAPGAASAAPRAEQLYVSLGDSYASGYQPGVVPSEDGNTRNGFAYQVPALAASRGYRLRLENFGCGGATTTSIISSKGCPPRALGPGGRAYPGQSQLAAAEGFLRKNRRKTGLVTVSIGGNDITACVAPPIPWVVVAGVAVIEKNVSAVAKRLRRAAGPRVRIVGITYPDVILGLWVNGDQASRDLASLSVFAFRSLINPALKRAYAKGNARFVDVTRASGAYTPFEQVTTLQPYGTVPVAVARACELSYFCAQADIHARTDGYALIARLVAGQLPRR